MEKRQNSLSATVFGVVPLYKLKRHCGRLIAAGVRPAIIGHEHLDRDIGISIRGVQGGPLPGRVGGGEDAAVLCGAAAARAKRLE